MLAKNLYQWFINHGGKLQAAAEIAYDDINGYHLRAKADLDISNPVVHCPRSITLSVDNVDHRQPPWSEAFISKFRYSSPEVLVRFLLIDEYLRGLDSKWWPYIACLPGPDQELENPRINTPLWFNEHDRAWLKGTNIDAAIDERERLWRKELSEGLALLQGTVDCALYTW